MWGSVLWVVVLNGGTLVDIWERLGIVLGIPTVEGVLLASCGWRPGMLLNNALGSPTTENYPALNVNGAQVEKSHFKVRWERQSLVPILLLFF